jgi:uncharacterized protein YfaS (alpha-2-macroglobulin family)
VTYPNVLILGYLRSSGQANPDVQLMAEKYIATGYQRLLTFEAPGGGFSLFDQAPAEVFLTAYGLMQLSDMARVFPVDRAVIDRAVTWLFSQQSPDGAWRSRDLRSGTGNAATTAFVTWALVEAGYADSPRVAQAIDYIRELALQEEDAYNLALVVNALAAHDPKEATTRSVVGHLYEMRVQDGDVVYWNTTAGSYMGATGRSGSIETTALAAIALMRAEAHPDAVSGALAYLIQGKDSWGTWSTTQATILSLKAMLRASELGGETSSAPRLRVSLNDELTQEIAIDQHNVGVVHLVTFDHGFSPSGDNRVRIKVEDISGGGANLMYQVTTRYYLPWDKVPETPKVEELMTIDVAYDRTELDVNDTVTVDVQARLNYKGVVKMALIDLGVPPGFTVLTEDLGRLVDEGVISRYELTGRQIIVYVQDLHFGGALRFSYRLRARFPMRAQTPPSAVYDYYNPELAGDEKPQLLVVGSSVER